MAVFTENRLNLIGNEQINELANEINRRFLNDLNNLDADRSTAVGRILYGLSGEEATLTDSVIKGGRSIRYLDERSWRSPNALSFVVVNADACQVQNHIAYCAASIDPHVIVSNFIRDEYYKETVFRYVRISHGQVIEYASRLAIPQGNYSTEAGRNRLIKHEKKCQLFAFNLLKKDLPSLDIGILELK